MEANVMPSRHKLPAVGLSSNLIRIQLPVAHAAIKYPGTNDA